MGWEAWLEGRKCEWKRRRTPLAPKSIEPGTRPLDVEETETSFDTGCMVCGQSSDPHLILLCDGCDNEAHLACVGLSQVPAGDWFCSSCRPRHRRSRQHPPKATSRRRNKPEIDEIDGIRIEAFAESSSPPPRSHPGNSPSRPRPFRHQLLFSSIRGDSLTNNADMGRLGAYSGNKSGEGSSRSKRTRGRTDGNSRNPGRCAQPVTEQQLPELLRIIRDQNCDPLRKIVSAFLSKFPKSSNRQVKQRIHEIAEKGPRVVKGTKGWRMGKNW